MKKIVIGLIILTAIAILFWQQNSEKRQVWIQVVGFLILFYGMSRLSAKTPSKYKNEDENKMNNDV